MNRKIIALILTGIISVLLVTGCSSNTEDQNVSTTGTTETAAETKEEAGTILPSDAKIGIAYTEEEGEFTSLFIAKTLGYLVSAGVPEDGIERAGSSAEDLKDNAQKLIDGGCSVLMVGNADENNAPAITDAAVKAGIPILYFGTSPGDAEIARWKENGWRAACVDSAYDQAAEKRADLISSTDMEKIDLNKNDEIGMVVMYSGEEKAGDLVNRDTVRLLNEWEVPVYELNADEEETSEESEENTDEDNTDEEDSDEQDSDNDVSYSEQARESAKEQVIEWMTEYGKELEVILCSDDLQALGAWDAISEEKKKVGHDVLIMGFDSITESLKEVASGNIRSSFFNDFMEQSQNASDMVLAFLKGNGAGEENHMTSQYVSVTVDNAQEILDISIKAQENDPDSEGSGEE